MNFKPKTNNNNMQKRRSFMGKKNGRTNNGHGNGNHSGNSYDQDQRPDGRAVKNAINAREKYLNMARDALMGGDRVLAENYYQHADHYLRIINLAEVNNPQPQRQHQPREQHNNGENRNQQPQTFAEPAVVPVSLETTVAAEPAYVAPVAASAPTFEGDAAH